MSDKQTKKTVVFDYEVLIFKEGRSKKHSVRFDQHTSAMIFHFAWLWVSGWQLSVEELKELLK